METPDVSGTLLQSRSLVALSQAEGVASPSYKSRIKYTKHASPNNENRKEPMLIHIGRISAKQDGSGKKIRHIIVLT